MDKGYKRDRVYKIDERNLDLAVRYAEEGDRAFWFRLDRHLPASQFAQKVRDRQGYVLLESGAAVGLLRYGLFWDTIPFCNLLYIDEAFQGQGYGCHLMTCWEADMRGRGYDVVMTSTRADEGAQHFYRKLGYRDCGGLILEIPACRQPTELFFIKELGKEDHSEGEQEIGTDIAGAGEGVFSVKIYF